MKWNQETILRRWGFCLLYVGLCFARPLTAPAVTMQSAIPLATVEQATSAYDAGSVRVVPDNVLPGSEASQATVPPFGQVTGLVAAKRPVVIGENMNRVNAYAGKVGGETIDGWLAGRKWTQQLNDEFISTMKAQGRQFQDIGPDFGRRLQNRIDPNLGRPPSSVYGGERQSLLDYGNYQRLYERTGQYQGGVPGFDP